MREQVGIIDLTPFTKHEITGPGAEAWLDGLVANKVPTKVGRMALSHALTPKGGIRSEFTITKVADQHFYVVSAGAAERFDGDYLMKALARGWFGAAAQHHQYPRLLRGGGAEVTRGTHQAYRHATRQRCLPVAHRADHRGGARGGCLCAARQLRRLAGMGAALSRSSTRTTCSMRCSMPAPTHGIGMVGMRAMESLRMEKSYRMWGSDMTPDYTPVRGEPGSLRAHEEGSRSLAGGAGEAARRGGAEPLRDPGGPRGYATPTRSAMSRCLTRAAA